MTGGWPIVRLRAVAAQAQTGPFGSQLHAEDYVENGIPLVNPSNLQDGALVADWRATVDDQTAKRLSRHRLSIGDLIFARRGEIGRSAVVAAESVGWLCGTGSLRVTLRQEMLDSRFGGYVLQSDPTRQFFAKQAVGSTMENLNTNIVLNLPIPYPPIAEQRRIADFLDSSCAAVERERSAFMRLRALIREREHAVLERVLTPHQAGDAFSDNWLGGSWRWVPLAHLTQPARPIMYGIVLPGPNVEDGVPIVKGGDVAGRRLRLDLLCRTTREIEASYKRSRLRGGDLVIAIRGSVGEVEMVPDELTGANLTQDAARISIGKHIHGRWLELVLKTPTVLAQMKSRITGATIQGINIWDLKRISVPAPCDVSEQSRIARRADREVALHEQIISRVDRHLRLIDERRQALITAAVTGQIDVTTAQVGHA